MDNTKKMGLPSGVAVCVGLIVATSCLLSLGQGIGLAGPMFVIPLLAVVILNGFIALSFAELHSLMPGVNGGLGQYTMVGLGPFASIITNISAYVIVSILAGAAEVAMCGMVLNSIFHQVPSIVFSMGILLILFATNLRGVDVFSKIQNVVAFTLVGSMLTMGIVGFFKLGTGTPIAKAAMETPAITGVGSLMGLAALAFWLFIGVEFIIPVSKNLKNAKRNVLLSMILALVTLFVVQAILGTGMANYVPLSTLSGSEMPHMAYAEAVLGTPGKIWMGIVTCLAAVSTMNTLFPSVGAIMQGMAEEGMLPKVFARTNKKDVAYAGMALLVICNITLNLTGFVNKSGLVTLILAASCFWLTAYIFTHATVLVLRRRHPNAPRNKYMVAFGIPQIIGIVGNIYMIWNISSDMASRLEIYKIFGILFVALAVFAGLWVKFVMKKNLFEPTSIDEISNIDEEESVVVEFKRAA
ncbi:MAG: APC family permease [Clostridiales Family XIII bacterium]|jgi:amino acid transporter|nr:APC family permease [Clostridiales Family XIII bacterium]